MPQVASIGSVFPNPGGDREREYVEYELTDRPSKKGCADMRNAWRQSNEETRTGSPPARRTSSPRSLDSAALRDRCGGPFPLPGLNHGYEEEIRS